MGVLDLQRAEDLLRAAANPRIRVERLSWPQMREVLRALKAFRDSTNALSAREEEIKELAWQWVRACLDCPVPPSDPSTGYPKLIGAVEAGIRELNTDRLVRLHRTLGAAASTEHPAAQRVIDRICEYPDSAVLVVRSKNSTDSLRAWAKEAEIDVDVVTATSTRASGPWEAAILFGPPERYVASPWLLETQAAAAGGWLLTTPVAPEVTVFLWTGHGDLRKDGAYAPWKGAPSVPFASETTATTEEVALLPTYMDTFKPVALPTLDGEKNNLPVEATALQFRAQEKTLLALFSKEAGPKPSVAAFEEGGVGLTSPELANLRPGHCLVFRTQVAGKDALDRATEVWLTEHRPNLNVQQVERLRQDLKEQVGLAIARSTRREFLARLEEEGMSREYARQLPDRLLHPEFIAPQTEENYLRVCRAAGKPRTAREFELLETLRTARRQAGTKLASKIEDHLNQIPELSDVLRDEGAYHLQGEEVSGVVLVVLRTISEELVKVPVGRLGSLLDERGKTWRP